MPVVPNVVSRDVVVTRLAATESKAIVAALERINILLSTCVDLPLTLEQDVLGVHYKVRNDIERRLKTAGWRVEFSNDTKQYTIQ